MGVTDLWSVLEPVRNHVPLTALAGQVIAVDLSVWIVSSQTVTKMMGNVSKPHLRNLFFRVSHLMQNDVLPVFVVDGDAPEVKWNAIAERCRVQQKSRGLVKSDHGAAKKPKRPQLTAAIRECCELLDYLGVPYVRAEGEAEALCAALNQHKLVDAVITDDGDAFLYGATRVYKNFTITKEPSVDSYRMADVEAVLKLSREKLIALALFVGCDYDAHGVPGVGKSQAVQLLTAMPDQAVIRRLRQWSVIPPDELLSYERSVAAKAMELKEFPNEEVISEFLAERNLAKFCRTRFCWQAPHLSQLQKFLKEKLEWPLAYSAGKCVPLLTLWQMTRAAPVLDRAAAASMQQLLRPLRIVKKRIRNGVSCAEVEWQKPEELLVEDATTATLVDEAGDCEAGDAVLSSSSTVVVTVEKLKLLERCYAQLIEEFETALTLKRTSKTRTRKQVGATKVEVTGTAAADDDLAWKSQPQHEREGLRERADGVDVLQDIMLRMNCLGVSSVSVPSIFARGDALVGETLAYAESAKAHRQPTREFHSSGSCSFVRSSDSRSNTYVTPLPQAQNTTSRHPASRPASHLNYRPHVQGSESAAADQAVARSSSSHVAAASEKPQRPAAAAATMTSILPKVDRCLPCDSVPQPYLGDGRSRNADGVFSLVLEESTSPHGRKADQNACEEQPDEGNDSVELFDLQPDVPATASDSSLPSRRAAGETHPPYGEQWSWAASGVQSKAVCSALLLPAAAAAEALHNSPLPLSERLKRRHVQQ